MLGGTELEPSDAAPPASGAPESAVAPTVTPPPGPLDVAVDRAGIVFVANSARNRVDRIDSAEGAAVPAGAVPAGAAAAGGAPTPAPGDAVPEPSGPAGSVCDVVGEPPAAGTVSVSSTVAAPGQELALQGNGFDAGEQLTVTLCSVPRMLGSITADPAGRYQANIRIPADAALGAHHLVVSDVRGNAAVAPILAQRGGRSPLGAEQDPEITGTADEIPEEQFDAEADAAADQAAQDDLAALEDDANAFFESTDDTGGIPTTGAEIGALLRLATLSLASGLVLVARSRRSTTS